MKKIVIAAGTGFLGQVLVDHFKDKVSEIVVLTRGNARKEKNIRYVNWDASTLTGWENELEGAEVLINLAGKSVDCRYTEHNKNEIIMSRVNSTTILNKAVLRCKTPPVHWLNSSTATIYRHSENKRMTESTGEIGHDFSMNVAKMWERAFFRTGTPKTHKTALRTSIVLGKYDGAYPVLKKMAKQDLAGSRATENNMLAGYMKQTLPLL